MSEELLFMRDTIVITNRALVDGDYLTQIEKITALHPKEVILREKNLTDEEYEALAVKVLAVCERAEVPCFLHSKSEIAGKLGCRNIHLPIRMLGEMKSRKADFDRISVSCHSMEDAKEAIAFGASQIVLGTIFETDCKKGLKGRGLGFVSDICRYTKEHGDIPVYAIGGIDPNNIQSVKEAGAAGGCMMSYMMKL